jgi:hypothetical protein
MCVLALLLMVPMTADAGGFRFRQRVVVRQQVQVQKVVQPVVVQQVQVQKVYAAPVVAPVVVQPFYAAPVAVQAFTIYP